MLKTQSLVSALAAIALALTGMTATAGSWPNLPAKKSVAATSDKPADARAAQGESILVREATAAGDFEYVGGDAGWQLRQHRYVLRSGGFAHAPECVLARNAATAPGRKAGEPAGFRLPDA